MLNNPNWFTKFNFFLSCFFLDFKKWVNFSCIYFFIQPSIYIFLNQEKCKREKIKFCKSIELNFFSLAFFLILKNIYWWLDEKIDARKVNSFFKIKKNAREKKIKFCKSIELNFFSLAFFLILKNKLTFLASIFSSSHQYIFFKIKKNARERKIKYCKSIGVF